MNDIHPSPVRIGTGLIQGVFTGPLTVYKSIPYAAPPVGELRWRAPHPASPWQGVCRADTFGPISMQTGISVPGAPPESISEDCLTLNIRVPAKSGAENLPVMIWIPGGGLHAGIQIDSALLG
jgi:para-nitrobenzyl esterase